MKKMIYISVPMTIPLDYVHEVMRLINNSGAYHSAWVRDSIYSPVKTDIADAVVVILPNISWKAEMNSITSGTKSEIERTIKQKKPIFLAYWSQEGLKIYGTSITDNLFSGVAGTSRNFSNYLNGEFTLTESGKFWGVSKDRNPWVDDQEPQDLANYLGRIKEKTKSKSFIEEAKERGNVLIYDEEIKKYIDKNPDEEGILLLLKRRR